MQTGVILCYAHSDELRWLKDVAEKVHARNIAVFLSSEKRIRDDPGRVTQFVLRNNLKGVVVACNLVGGSLREALQYSFETAGLDLRAAGYVDTSRLADERTAKDQVDTLYAILKVNLERMEHRHRIGDVVSKSVLTSSGISRRMLLRSLPRGLRVESDIPTILKERCGDRSESCQLCLNACPVKAISRTDNAILINDRVCIECGACARECPTGAIQSPSISDAQFIAMLSTLTREEFALNERALLLTCPLGFERVTREARNGKYIAHGVVPISIPCVAAIGGMHYVWSAALGVPLITVCPDATCRKTVAVFPSMKQSQSCRELLGVFLGDGGIASYMILLADESVVDSVSRTRLASASGRTRLRLDDLFRRQSTIGALRALAANRRDVTIPPPGEFLPLFDITVNPERCTFCEFCRRDCPDHAIEFMKTDAYLSLSFDPGKCSGCKICATHCPENAIHVSRLGILSTAIEGMRREKARDQYAKCRNCGTALSSQRSLQTLEKRLRREGVSEASVRTLHLCPKCKQETIIHSENL